MSAYVHYTQVTQPELLDVVDDAWAQDKLPNDDVPLPDGVIAPTEENDELREEVDADANKPEKWTETGLHTVQ